MPNLGPGLLTAGVRWATVAVVGCALGLSLILDARAASFGAAYVLSHAQGVALHSDFLNYYSAARTLLEQPAALYQPDLEAALQRTITGQPDLYVQFQNMPQVALLFVPLAWLPYGLAYLLWAALNLALLFASAWLVAPRRPHWPPWPIWALAALVAYGPAQFTLIDGQTTFVALFGFCAWVACLERRRARVGLETTAQAGSLWLLSWAWKPQLLPVALLALVLSRAIRRSVVLVAAQALALGLVVLWAGPPVLNRYVTFAASAAQVDGPGQTVFGVAQALGGPSRLTALLSVLGAALVAAAIGAVWWRGVRPDAPRLLQLAIVPLGAVLLAARAYAFEQTLWLASAWLVLRYLDEVRDQRHARVRAALCGVLGVAWLGTTLSILNGGDGVPWSALSGLGLLAVLVGEFFAWPTASVSSVVRLSRPSVGVAQRLQSGP